MHINCLNHVLRSRFFNTISFISNGNQYAIFSQKFSSIYKMVLLKQTPKVSLAYPGNKLLQEKCNESLFKSQSIQYKSSKSKKNRNENDQDSEESDEEEDEEWILEKGKNFKDIKVNIPSLRLDAVLKGGLGISRNKIEDGFYGGKIKINRSKPKKKSIMIKIGDFLDVKEESGSSEFARVKLLKVGRYNESNDTFPVLIRKYPKLFSEDLDKEEE